MKTCPVCKIDILEHPANRCLDELIFIHIFGYTKLPFPAMPEFQKPTDNGVYATYHVNRYSTSIQAAWEVVKEMSANNYWCNMRVLSSHCKVLFENAISRRYEAKALTYELSLAICRAAMLTVDE